MKNELKFSSRSYKSVKFITVKMRNLEKSHFVAQRNKRINYVKEIKKNTNEIKSCKIIIIKSYKNVNVYTAL